MNNENLLPDSLDSVLGVDSVDSVLDVDVSSSEII